MKMKLEVKYAIVLKLKLETTYQTQVNFGWGLG